MRRAFVVFVVLAASAVGAAAAQAPSPSPVTRQTPAYTIDAIRYATIHDFALSNLVIGASKDAKTDIAMAIWLIRGGDRTILFDTGFHRARWMSAFKIDEFLSPDNAVRLAGVEPGSVTDLIVSHAHWDHMGGIDLFPNATIWIQKAEYEYYTGAAWQTGGRKGGIDAEDIQELVRRNLAGKVRLVDGDDQEVLPGVRAYTGARHTFASQYIRVGTKQPVVLASDNCYLYENLNSHRASATFERSDETANIAAQKRMIGLAGDIARVIPGHDPEQFVRHKATGRVARIQTADSPDSGTTFDEAAPAGDNYDKADFRLWYPGNTKAVRAVVALVPGSNGDARAQVDDPVWRAFATKHRLALLGVRVTDKPHDQAFIESYVNVSQGSGQVLLDGLATFAGKSGHPELAGAPLLLWGMSAGGQFNYEFVNWRPERVIGFVVNKGGIYYTALTSRTARAVPGILFVGGRDLDSRAQTITGLFALNRRAGALWALAEEPGAGHIVGRSREMAILFFEDILAARLGEGTVNSADALALHALAENSGFLGDAKTKEIWKIGDKDAPNYPTSWLPTLRMARAWQALLTEKPFDP
jgi:glyoxylase-like metal-dependent hydrolase (beta-lactamase superfamily II)